MVVPGRYDRLSTLIDAGGAVDDDPILEPGAALDRLAAWKGEARRQLAVRAKEIVTETLGTESPAARAIAARVGERDRPAP